MIALFVRIALYILFGNVALTAAFLSFNEETGAFCLDTIAFAADLPHIVGGLVGALGVSATFGWSRIVKKRGGVT